MKNVERWLFEATGALGAGMGKLLQLSGAHGTNRAVRASEHLRSRSHLVPIWWHRGVKVAMNPLAGSLCANGHASRNTTGHHIRDSLKDHGRITAEKGTQTSESGWSANQEPATSTRPSVHASFFATVHHRWPTYVQTNSRTQALGAVRMFSIGV